MHPQIEAVVTVTHPSGEMCTTDVSLVKIARVFFHGNDNVAFDAMSSSVS
jgi:hypothetical protein